MKWTLFALLGLVLLLALALRSSEHFMDTESPVTRPVSNSVWNSKVDALAPTGAVNADYLTVLGAFYDTVYSTSPTKPTEAQVDTFLASSAGTVAGVDKPSIKRILMDAFHIGSTKTAAQNEEASQNFVPSDADLAPKMGVDEVRTRKEDAYNGANPTPSTRFSEGDYEPVTQTEPINPGMWNDGSSQWKGPRPASVCACAENVM